MLENPLTRSDRAGQRYRGGREVRAEAAYTKARPRMVVCERPRDCLLGLRPRPSARNGSLAIRKVPRRP